MRKLPSLHRLLARLLTGPALAGALALGLAAPAVAQTAAPAAAAPAVAAAPEAKGPPAGFVAPAEPKPDETNAQRGKSQPGNNAPYWRDVRESGNREGTVSSPIPEGGVLIQSFVQYPGSRFTTAGEAWRQVRNQWIIPYGGSLLLIAALALALFYWRKGPLGGHEAGGHDDEAQREDAQPEQPLLAGVEPV